MRCLGLFSISNTPTSNIRRPTRQFLLGRSSVGENRGFPRHHCIDSYNFGALCSHHYCSPIGRPSETVAEVALYYSRGDKVQWANMPYYDSGRLQCHRAVPHLLAATSLQVSINMPPNPRDPHTPGTTLFTSLSAITHRHLLWQRWYYSLYISVALRISSLSVRGASSSLMVSAPRMPLNSYS